MKIKGIAGTVFVIYLLMMIGVNQSASAALNYQSTLGESGVTGADNAHFDTPFGVAVDLSGNIYVVDNNNQRVQKFNSAGVYQSTIGVTGVTGTDNAHFDNPTDVAVDSSDNLFVVDFNNQRVQRPRLRPLPGPRRR